MTRIWLSRVSFRARQCRPPSSWVYLLAKHPFHLTSGGVGAWAPVGTGGGLGASVGGAVASDVFRAPVLAAVVVVVA